VIDLLETEHGGLLQDLQGHIFSGLLAKRMSHTAERSCSQSFPEDKIIQSAVIKA
jgi:hypothetical protein